MKVTIQMIIYDDEGTQKTINDIACLQRRELSAETLGLTLEEAKVIVAA